MGYPEFREELLNSLYDIVPKNIHLQIMAVEKLNNCLRYGISFAKSDVPYAPTIYLEPFYRSFQKGRSLDEIARELYRCYEEETGQIPDSIQKLEAYETAKEDIYCKLIHLQENLNLLKDTPHLVFLDFAIVPYFEVNNENIYKGSVLLKQHHLNCWQISTDTLMSWALLHTKEQKGVLFRPMSDILTAYISEEDGEIYERARTGMFVLTNKEKYLGAVLAFFPEVLKDIFKELKEDFYLLPASVHEWVVVPESEVVDRELLFVTVRNINDSEVLEEEILSYNVYYYSGSSQKIHVFNPLNAKND